MANSHRGPFPKVSEIQPGTRFVDATAGRWTDSKHQERTVEVIRKTNTRLILALVNDDGEVVPQREYRLIVRDGEVTEKVEGVGDRYPMRLYTLDDPDLAAMRAASRRADLRFEAKRASETASRDLDVEKAQDAIQKLQAYIDSYNPEED